MFWPFTVWKNCSGDPKNFANSRPSASNFETFSRSLEQFFLPVGQNNFGNKIPFLFKSRMSITIPLNTKVHNAFCGFAWYYLSTLISFMRKPSSFLHSKIFVQIVHLFQLLKSMMSNICQTLKYFVIVNYVLVNVKSKYHPSNVNLMRPLPERKLRKNTFPPCHVHWWE